MTRILQPELLDELPSMDPRAIHSRRDLRRINSIMGNARAITRFVVRCAEARFLKPPISIVEIGAGEGYVVAHVARALSNRGIFGNVTLVDRQPLKTELVEKWAFKTVEADVFDWLNAAEKHDVVIANLFLHHFSDDKLTSLLGGCARFCDCFAAAEPRRSRFAEWFAARVKLVGCNDVTLHDAEISVRAGFNDSDLTCLWPQRSKWTLIEKRTGFFTHFFGAIRD